jgi:hypothetical protein
MAELTIDASEITAALKKNVEDYTPAVGTEQIGRIVEVGDGIARVSGLPGAAVNELLEFEDGTLARARSTAPNPAAWRSRRRGSSAASPWPSPCRPASRPLTP